MKRRFFLAKTLLGFIALSSFKKSFAFSPLKTVKNKVLISGCLLGEKIRYDGSDFYVKSNFIIDLQNEGLVIPFCPELAAGMLIPRLPAEINQGEGKDVVYGNSKVIEINGKDVTRYFLEGAKKFEEIAKRENIKMVILKDGSPSCGSNFIYDGKFAGETKKGKGVSASILEFNGIKTFSENNLEEARSYYLNL